MSKIVLITIACVGVFAFGYFFYFSRSPETLSGSLCEIVTEKDIENAVQKNIERIDSGPVKDPAYCEYYIKNTSESPFVSAHFENMVAENQRKGQESLGRKITTNTTIPMEHFIATQENGEINTIYLVINPNQFISIGRSSKDVVNNENMIALAASIAQIIKGKTFTIPTRTQVIVTPRITNETFESKQQIAETFMKYLSDKKIDDALKMMDADENTKQAWGVNFNTIKSLRIEKVEPVYQDEWTKDRQVYKFTLTVSVTPQGEQMGWENGTTTRWVSVENNNGTWQIHELANNP